MAYHSVGSPQFGINDVTPRRFEQHLQIAVDAGWSFGTTADVLARPSERILAITFDDGATSVLTNAMPVLRHHGVPATIFVVTGWADGNSPRGHEFLLDWKGIGALADAGVTVASHSVSHPDFGKLSHESALRELVESRARLHKALGVETDEFAIPLGQSRNWTDDAQIAAKEAGYRLIYAQAVETRHEGTVPRTFITAADRPHLFRAALSGAYDAWEEWY